MEVAALVSLLIIAAYISSLHKRINELRRKHAELYLELQRKDAELERLQAGKPGPDRELADMLSSLR